jgi:hypothetical protein
LRATGVYIRVHEDREQVFDDAMDQKAMVTKEVEVGGDMSNPRSLPHLLVSLTPSIGIAFTALTKTPPFLIYTFIKPVQIFYPISPIEGKKPFW